MKKQTYTRIVALALAAILAASAVFTVVAVLLD